MKAPLRWGRRTLTRILHPIRRRRALGVAQREAPLRSVLFVCLGNVCRSPYAEYALRALVDARGPAPVTVESAGFIGPGRASPDEAQATARARGLDLSGHVSRVVTREMADAHGMVIVMEPAQAGRVRATGARAPVLVLGDLDPERPDRRSIQDPWGRPPEEFQASFDRIDRCLVTLLPFLARSP